MVFEYLKTSWKRPLGVFLSMGGFGLIMEHYFFYNELDFFDFLGHEWIGFISLIIGLIFITNFSYFNPIEYAKEKIKFLFNG